MKNTVIALLMGALLGCDGEVTVEKRRGHATFFAKALYPGWSIVGIVANDSWTVWGRRVSMTLRDPATGAIVRMMLICDEQGLCIEGPPPGCAG